MRRQAGFTLIELVMVIVILGILAATALPKFVDLETKAREAVLDGGRGALLGAAAITYAKHKTDGNTGKPTLSDVTANLTADGLVFTNANSDGCTTVQIEETAGGTTTTADISDYCAGA